MSDPGKFPHYMLKEIFDQPQGLRDTITPRIALEQAQVSHIWTLPQGETGKAKQITTGETPDVLVASGPNGKVLVANDMGKMAMLSADGSHREALVPDANVRTSISNCGDRYIVFNNHISSIQLWRADADGGNPRELVNDISALSNCSADGKSVVYSSNLKLYRMPVEGGNPAELVSSTVSTPSGEMSPDGQWVAYVYSEGGLVPVLKIGIIPASGGQPAHTFPRPSGANELHWAPDGKGVQFLLTRNGATNVWEQYLIGGDPKPVTNFTSGTIFDFAWTRDGKTLLLAKGEITSDVVLVTNLH
jgi:Tol biopolymer transport system component